jgi:hypothetical protein
MKTRTILSVPLLIACVACASSEKLPRGQPFVSPLGGFSCAPYPKFETGVETNFGPRAGTVRLTFLDLDMTRIDVQEFDPKIEDPAQLRVQEQAIYEGYLKDNILPLVKQGVPKATIAKQKHAEVNGRRVHISALVLPESSNTVMSGGKRVDGVRAQIQFTNGRFIYILSRIDPINLRQDWSPDQNIDNSIRIITETFGKCTFPS